MKHQKSKSSCLLYIYRKILTLFGVKLCDCMGFMSPHVSHAQ